MSMKHIRILLFYFFIVLAMGFTYLVVQNRYSYERTHSTVPSESSANILH